MQTVSQAWKDNQNEQLVSESFVEVILTLADPDASDDASSTDNAPAYISNTEQVCSEVDKDIVPYATLEKNLWVLDGSLDIIPNPNGENVFPSNANLSGCTRNGNVFTRKGGIYDSILSLSSWMPEAGKHYILVIDVLDDVIAPGNTLSVLADSRFAFENVTQYLKYGKNYVSVRARETIKSDMLGSVWLNSPLTFPQVRFTMSILKDSDFGDCGYIGNAISSSSGVFTTKPVVTINFSQVHSNLLSGVTITWGSAYDEYAVDFTVTAYNGEAVVAKQEIIGNTDVKSVVYMDIVDYDRITISVSKWCLPYRRARIEEILVGVEKTYSKRDLFSFSHTQEVDPISSSLPKAEISFSIDNSDDSYNINNLNSLSKYLMERQEIKTRYGYNIGGKTEWIDSGTFYISEWDAPQNGMTADFTARDLLEFMTGTYYKGLYNPNGVSLYDLAVSVLEDADLPLEDDGSVKWVIDERLKNIYTVAPLPMDTHANCLQLIANASESVLYQDRRGVLHLEKLVTSETDYSITPFNSYSKSDITLSKPLKQVDVPYYSYNVSSELAELYKGVVTINGTTDVWITYSGTATNIEPWVTGGTLNSGTCYANGCKLNITANGEIRITVKGNTLESSSINVVTPSGITGETITVDNPLITSQDRAVAIGSWVEGYMKNRMVLNSEWRADPRLDALDVVDNENDYNTNKVLMTTVKYKYNGAFRGSGEGRVI